MELSSQNTKEGSLSSRDLSNPDTKSRIMCSTFTTWLAIREAQTTNIEAAHSCWLVEPNLANWVIHCQEFQWRELLFPPHNIYNNVVKWYSSSCSTLSLVSIFIHSFRALQKLSRFSRSSLQLWTLVLPSVLEYEEEIEVKRPKILEIILVLLTYFY